MVGRPRVIGTSARPAAATARRESFFADKAFRKSLRRVLRDLQELKPAHQRDIFRSAMKSATVPARNDLRGRLPRLTGRMRGSIAKKEKTYTKGEAVTVWAGIGQDMKAAAEYRALSERTRLRKIKRIGGGISSSGKAAPLHFVDKPVKAHAIQKESSERAISELGLTRDQALAFGLEQVANLRFHIGRRLMFRRRVYHPGMRGGDYVDLAFRSSRRKVQTIFANRLRVLIANKSRQIRGRKKR